MGVAIGLHLDLGKELLVLVPLDRLVLLEGGRGHCGTEGVVVHGDGHVLGAGLPTVQLGGAFEQLDLACAVRDSWGCALLETDSSRDIVLVGLGAVMAGDLP